MKTVQDLINEHRERENPKYSQIVVKKWYCNYDCKPFYNVSNLKEDGDWLEFDCSDKVIGELCRSITKNYHVKIYGQIVKTVERL